uniref:Uncharacterized protein n=1 Tax=Anguilla anguilla TaxID=7936 RepID=A0A0E9WMG0_ANGAN
MHVEHVAESQLFRQYVSLRQVYYIVYKVQRRS